MPSSTLLTLLAIVPHVYGQYSLTRDDYKTATTSTVAATVKESACMPGEERIVFIAPTSHCMSSDDPKVNCFEAVENFIDDRVQSGDYRGLVRRNLRGEVEEESQEHRELWVSCPICMVMNNNNVMICYAMTGRICDRIRRAQELSVTTYDTFESTSLEYYESSLVTEDRPEYYDLLAIEEAEVLGTGGLSTHEWADVPESSDTVMKIASLKGSSALKDVQFTVQVCRETKI